MLQNCDCNNDDKSEKETSNITNEMLKTRSILVSEDITDKTAKSVITQVLILNQRSETEHITVYVNSPGGSADSGMAIYDILKFSTAPIRTVAIGLCGSAAVTVFMGAGAGQHFCTPNTRFLLHQPSTGIQGDASDISITADEIEQVRRRYNEIVAGVTGKTVEQVTKDADRDFWMSAEQALEYRLVSKIIRTKSDW